jgi:hypothetical protein
MKPRLIRLVGNDVSESTFPSVINVKNQYRQNLKSQ